VQIGLSIVAPKQRLQVARAAKLPGSFKVRREGGSRVRTANPKILRAEVRKLRNTQKALHNALRLLFELLEEYSPMWYQKHNNDQAKAALKRVERIRIEHYLEERVT